VLQHGPGGPCQTKILVGWATMMHFLSSLLADSMVERCRTDDLMPNVHICCLPPRRVDPEVQGLKVIVDCPQPGSSRATYRPPAIAGGLSAASMTR